MDTLDRLNALYLSFAEEANPHGYELAQGLPLPRDLEELRDRMWADDYLARPYRIACGTRYETDYPGLAVLAYFSWHDRGHVNGGHEFTRRGEFAAGLAEYKLLKAVDPEAARLHARIVRDAAHRWRDRHYDWEGGSGRLLSAGELTV